MAKVIRNHRFIPSSMSFHETVVVDGAVIHSERSYSGERNVKGKPTDDDMALLSLWPGDEAVCNHNGVSTVEYDDGRKLLIIIQHCHKIRTKEESDKHPVVQVIVESEGAVAP